MSNNLLDLKMSDALWAAIEKAAERKLTSEEILEQRVSFVVGSMDQLSNVTRERVRQVLVEHEGRPA